MYDLTLLAEYPFKLSDNTLFKICNRFLIVYTNKSLIVYRLYSFKVQDEYLSDKKILDVHYNELGLFILTSTGFYQFEKHDIYLDFSLSIAYEQFVIHYLDSIKGFVMFMSLQGYLIMYFTVVGNRLLVDHSKTVSIDFNHLTTRKWHVNVNALLEIEDGFLLFQMGEKLQQSCIGSFKSIEHGANSINALLNFLVDIELKAQYDINALQDVFEQQLNLVTNKHQTEQRIYKKSSNGTVKTISSKLKKLNDTHSTLETVQSNELRTLRETKESQVLQTIMQVEDESEQFIKETRQLLIKFEKDKTSEQAKFIEKLAQITTFHIRENNKLTTSLTGVVHSIDFCKEQEKILHFEKINLLKSSLSNYESNYEEQKKEIYPIKSLLTVLEKKRLNLLHSLDMLKIKSNRSLTAEKDLINKITAVKGQIIKFKLAYDAYIQALLQKEKVLDTNHKQVGFQLKVKHILDHTLEEQMETVSPLDQDIESKNLQIRQSVSHLRHLKDKNAQMQDRLSILQRQLETLEKERRLKRIKYREFKLELAIAIQKPKIIETKENDELRLQIKELKIVSDVISRKEITLKRKNINSRKENIIANRLLLKQ